METLNAFNLEEKVNQIIEGMKYRPLVDVNIFENISNIEMIKKKVVPHYHYYLVSANGKTYRINIFSTLNSGPKCIVSVVNNYA